MRAPLRAAGRRRRWCSNTDETSVHIQGVANWKRFYADSKKYVKIGRVSHPAIDPETPIPEHCDPKKATARRSPEQVEGIKHHDEQSSSSSSSSMHERSEL